jgi:hypothetical protein
MTEVKKPGAGPRVDDAAARQAAEAARRSAEAARRAAEAAEASRRAAQQAAEAARAAGDGAGVSAAAGLEAAAGPTGAKAMPAMPTAPRGFEKFQGFGAGGDPADALRGRVAAALARNLAGKEGKAGVEAAMKGFREEVRALAKEAGPELAEALQAAVQQTVKANEGAIADVAEKGRRWWEKVGDFVGDVVGGAMDLAGDIAKDVADVAGDAVDAVTDAAADVARGAGAIAGSVADATIDAAGTIAGAALEGAGQVVGAGLDAVGADGAARAVRAGADLAGGAARAGADAVGDAARAGLELEGRIVGGALDLAGDAVDKGLDLVGGAADTALDVAGAVIAEGPMGAAGQLADGVLGPERAEFMGQIGGLTGVVTNRLGRGDGVFVRGEAGAEVGVGAFVGGKLTGGAVLGRDQAGNITLSLEVGLEAEAGLKAEIGGSVGTSLAGVGAKAEASASIVGTAKGKLNLKFNPDDPADVARLQALLEPTASKLAAAAVNPLAAASFGGGALDDAIAHNLASTEVAGSLGVKGGAKAKGDLGPLAAELGVGADAVVGGSLKTNKDGSTETTLYVKVGGKAAATATAGALAGVGGEAGVGAEAVIAVKVKRAKDGEITGISGEQDGRFGGSAGLIQKAKNAHTLAEGERGLKETKTNVGAGRSTTTSVETELNARGLAEAKARIAAGESILSAYVDLNDDPGKFTTVRSTTDTDSVTFGFGAELALGAKVGVKAGVTLGKTHTETERDQASDLHMDVATHALPFGGTSPDLH